MKRRFLIISLMLITITTFSAQKTELFKLTGPYLGQEHPGNTPEVFAPGIVSINDSQEFAGTFSPDGKEFFFTRRPEYDDFQAQRIWFTREISGIWTEPEQAPFSEDCMELEPFISPDGLRFYFGSSRPLPGENQNSSMPAIWIMEKTSEGWSKPAYFAPMMMYISEAGNRNLYYTDIAMGGCIAVKRWDGTNYGPAEKLSDNVNYVNSPAHPYIAPDESYLLYDGEENDGRRQIYVSFRKSDNTWTRGVKLGNQVNTEHGEMCPSVSPEGKYLFFESHQSGSMDIYWVDSKVIEELKPKDFK